MSSNVFCPGDVAAVVLAAGRSSRMGAFKPLLPFDGRTLIGHVVAGLRAAGVTRIHVVTGFNAEALAPEIDRLGVTRAHNADFDRGMLSSVQAGVASLPAETQAFLLAPVDVPLRARLDDRAAPRRRVGGRRGRPLSRVSRRARPSAADPARAVSRKSSRSTARAGSRPCSRGARPKRATFRCSTGGASRTWTVPRTIVDSLRRSCGAIDPDASECEAMLESAATPEPVRRHGGAVAAVAADIARRLRAAGEPIEPDRARAAALAARHRQRAAPSRRSRRCDGQRIRLSGACRRRRAPCRSSGRTTA